MAKFEEPGATSEKKGEPSFVARNAAVVELVAKMNECGAPPKELMGDMPAGESLSPTRPGSKLTAWQVWMARGCPRAAPFARGDERLDHSATSDDSFCNTCSHGKHLLLRLTPCIHNDSASNGRDSDSEFEVSLLDSDSESRWAPASGQPSRGATTLSRRASSIPWEQQRKLGTRSPTLRSGAARRALPRSRRSSSRSRRSCRPSRCVEPHDERSSP